MPVTWRDALPPLRMALAAVLSYALSTELHLPEAYWAALSAVIVSRPLPGAAVQAAADRLTGTLLGAGLGCALSFGRLWAIPDTLLLAAALLPLGALIAWRPGYRTAPIAAVIVLAASPAGHGPVAAALLRIAEIGLGACIGMAMSWILLPARAEQQAAKLCRGALRFWLGALDAAQRGDEAGVQALQAEARRCAATLARLIPPARWERADKETLARQQSAVARLAVSMSFAIRALAAARRAANPVLTSGALEARVAILRTGDPRNDGEPTNPPAASSLEPSDNWTALCGALPSPQHRAQAQALDYALVMARCDVDALSQALGNE